jgi:predicted DNA-binding protein
MISVRLDESIENQLNTLAQQKDTSKSKVIKEALVYYFDMLKNENEQKSAYELGSELFGKYSSGRDDLSTTYKQKIKDKINAKNNH